MNLGLNSITKKLQYGDTIRPARDWLILLGLFIIGLAACIVSGLLTFSSVVRGQPVGNAQVNVPAQIQLDQVNALFDARAEQRQQYDSSYRFVDPSL